VKSKSGNGSAKSNKRRLSSNLKSWESDDAKSLTIGSAKSSKSWRRRLESTSTKLPKAPGGSVSSLKSGRAKLAKSDDASIKSGSAKSSSGSTKSIKNWNRQLKSIKIDSAKKASVKNIKGRLSSSLRSNSWKRKSVKSGSGSVKSAKGWSKRLSGSVKSGSTKSASTKSVSPKSVKRRYMK